MGFSKDSEAAHSLVYKFTSGWGKLTTV